MMFSMLIVVRFGDQDSICYTAWRNLLQSRTVSMLYLTVCNFSCLVPLYASVLLPDNCLLDLGNISSSMFYLYIVL